MRYSPLVGALLGVTSILSAPASAQAAEPDPNRSPYTYSVAWEVPLTVGIFAVSWVPRLFVSEIMTPPCGGEVCDASTLNGLDEPVTRRLSASSATVSDVLFYSQLGLPYLLSAIDVAVSDPADGWMGYATDVAVYMETTAIVLGLNNLLSLIVRRPRPRNYNPNISVGFRQSPEAGLSFPSGHTAGSFALAVAYSFTFMKRHPKSPMVAPVWISLLGLATVTGWLRTDAGAHFWTDVIVGAALGATVGLVVPYLHLSDGDESDKLKVTVLPAGFPNGGFGAAVTVF